MKKLITVSMYLVIGALVTGVATATTPVPNTVPDAASTSSLLALTLAGLAAIRQSIRR